MNDHASNTQADVPDPGKLEELIEACLDRLDNSDSGAIDEMCRAHPAYAEALRRNVERLAELGFTPTKKLPRLGTIGPYRIVTELGRGGMGVVYAAERDDDPRRFAVKVLRHADVDSPAMRERFRREIDALSRLEHPGIVKIVGWNDDRDGPFIAMERVEGKTVAEILRFAETGDSETLSGADLAMRLAGGGSMTAAEATHPLFTGGWQDCILRIIRDAATALDHIHDRGVVHRDLKPSNIMVTPEGRVVILDFGLAFLGDWTRMTRTQAMLGSLPYMAPEQLVGEKDTIDRRSDVYALGVTLYELLTLTSPFRRETSERTRLAIENGDKPRPRDLRPAMSSDIETMILTAIERDPERRYGTAKALADDIDRVLDGRPIRARRPSVVRVIVDRARRRPAATIASVLFLLIVVGGPILSAIQERRAGRKLVSARDDAKRERDLAERRLTAAERAVDRMLVHVAEARLSEMPGMQPLRRKLLTEALAIYEELLSSAANDPSVVRRRAGVLTRAGRLNHELGDDVKAAEMLDEAIRVFETERSKSALDEMTAEWFVDAYSHRARIESDRKSRAGARAFLEKCLTVAEDMLRAAPSDPWMRKVADILNNLAMVDADNGDLVTAKATIDRAVALDERIGSGPKRKFTYAASLARVLFDMGKLDEADALADKTIPEVENYLEENPTDHTARSELVVSASNQGQIALRKEDWVKAEKALGLATHHAGILTRQEPLIVRYALREANAHIFLAGLFALTERASLAEAAATKAIGILELHRARDPKDIEVREALAGAAMNLAITQYGEKKLLESWQSFRQAADAFREILDVDAENRSIHENFVNCLLNTGVLSARLGHIEDAEKNLREAFTEACRSIGKPERRLSAVELAVRIHGTLIETLIDQRKLDEAVALAASLPEIAEDWRPAKGAALECLSIARSMKKFPLSDDARGAEAEKLRAKAVNLLRESARRGCPSTAAWDDAPDLRDLHGRDDFEALLDEVL